jgi:hypothetical protein
MCASLRDESQMDAVGLADIARQIRAYRPAATVFEADIAHAAKGQGLLASAARKSTAMQAKRAAHDKHIDKAKETGHGIVAPGVDAGRRRRGPTTTATRANSDDEFGDEGEGESESEEDAKPKAKGKKKKAVAVADAFDTGKFRDDAFFLDVTPRGVNHTELGLSTMEDDRGRPMQDHLSLEGALNDATMDIVEEDGKGISQQRRIRIWDKKKRNYVQVNASEVDRARGNKRVKTESGAVREEGREGVRARCTRSGSRSTHRSVAATGSQEDPLGNGRRQGTRRGAVQVPPHEGTVGGGRRRRRQGRPRRRRRAFRRKRAQVARSDHEGAQGGQEEGWPRRSWWRARRRRW